MKQTETLNATQPSRKAAQTLPAQPNQPTTEEPHTQPATPAPNVATAVGQENTQYAPVQTTPLTAEQAVEVLVDSAPASSEDMRGDVENAANIVPEGRRIENDYIIDDVPENGDDTALPVAPSDEEDYQQSVAPQPNDVGKEVVNTDDVQKAQGA